MFTAQFQKLWLCRAMAHVESALQPDLSLRSAVDDYRTALARCVDPRNPGLPSPTPIDGLADFLKTLRPRQYRAPRMMEGIAAFCHGHGLLPRSGESYRRAATRLIEECRDVTRRPRSALLSATSVEGTQISRSRARVVLVRGGQDTPDEVIKEYAGDDGHLVDCANELRFQADPASPRVLPIQALGATTLPDVCTLRMSLAYCAGGDAGVSHAQDYRCSDAQIAIARSALAIVADLHEAGIAHGDIKPTNFLFRTANGSADSLVVADFGSAYRPRTEDKFASGTPEFLPPEWVDDPQPGMWGPRWDVFALGVTLYLMIAHTHPFLGDTYYAGSYSRVKPQRHTYPGQPLKPPPVYRPFVPALARVLRTALSHDPTVRYPNASAMRADLERRLS